ncbi:MBL fold metallo-hydrolase [Iamia sp. SCSIO 61187]|uniref:MBL fold metallo-hydrolase RNA specificity domain-containing protein n=1 Tax=Iamia sp. SCSIO 61187 TaxID=2722752 RepID=UPI001C62B1A8|nr:MBL fold metallo-hydrolase [Iamia sp. SCSIO 61187]QYG92228.1 MBL fold metallo-hydrolase [Iamia sp. SCSIO 61187]
MTASVERTQVPVLSFLGAAGTVTGSRFLIDTPGARVLIDAGMFQGLKGLRRRNWAPFPVDPSTIDAVAVTHAHVDHTGYLPALVRDGYAGPIHATHGTTALARIVLPDAGHLQEEEAAYANRKGFSKHHPARPLYTEADARVAVERFAPQPFHREVEVAPGVHLTMRPAGHILGSATISVRLADHRDRRIVFSGDLGRPQHPILRPPDPVGAADIVVMESTYGNRRHDDAGALDRLRDAIVTTVARGGTVVIPAFAVDRTEVVLFHLRELLAAGAIPEVPVFVDSPMALSALRVYREAIARGETDVDPRLADRADAFGAGHITEIRDVERSKALADHVGPCIIVSASGMATGGRVVHHLARLLPDHRTTVLLVGFQAPGTRGRQLAEGARQVKMLGRYVPVRADVVDLAAFSVHADQGELVAWLDTADRPPDTVYLVHGEPDSAAALETVIGERDGWLAVTARDGERVRLD